MAQYGVSRPTLREAFRILEAESLISVRRGSRGGARVIAPDISAAARNVGLLLQMQGATINDVYEARMISEPACARLFALNHGDDDIEKLTEVVDALKAEVAARKPFIPDPHTWSTLTYRFHELILEGCGNKTMAVQGAVLADIVATHLRTKIAQRDESDTAERFGLARRIPLGEALRWALVGLDERMSARRAREIGLVSELVPQAQLWSRAAELAASIAAKPPAVVQGTVRAIWETHGLDRETAQSIGWHYTRIGNPLGKAEVSRAMVVKPNWTLR